LEVRDHLVDFSLDKDFQSFWEKVSNALSGMGVLPDKQTAYYFWQAGYFTGSMYAYKDIDNG